MGQSMRNPFTWLGYVTPPDNRFKPLESNNHIFLIELSDALFLPNKKNAILNSQKGGGVILKV